MTYHHARSFCFRFRASNFFFSALAVETASAILWRSSASSRPFSKSAAICARRSSAVLTLKPGKSTTSAVRFFGPPGFEFTTNVLGGVCVDESISDSDSSDSSASDVPGGRFSVDGL
ncbi:hypothetical protein BC629DRAFT_883821 [Irpex lacteus]|nr:hypothetical protein BC629DRAFT_883821 [Irpex lacteus]